MLELNLIVKELRKKIQMILSDDRMPISIQNSVLYKIREDLEEEIDCKMKQILNKKVELKKKQNLLNLLKFKLENPNNETLKELILRQNQIIKERKAERDSIHINRIIFSKENKFDLKIKNYAIDQLLGYDIQFNYENNNEIIIKLFSNYTSSDNFHLLYFKNKQLISINSSSESVKIDTRALSKYFHLNQYGRFFVEYTLLKAEQSTIIRSQEMDDNEL